MLRITATAAALLALTSVGTVAAPNIMVQQIDAQIDLTAITNQMAAERYGKIESDLEGAVASLLLDHIGDQGVKIFIDISEFELNNSFQESMNISDTRLVGDVQVTDEENNSNFDSYKVTVDVNQAKLYFPEGTDLITMTTNSDTYYNAMISAFANTVVVRLLK